MKKILLSSLLCLSVFAYADTGLDAARTLASEDIIVDQSQSGQSDAQEASRYRLNDPILRQEVLGAALKLWGPDTYFAYQCKGYFVDINESWVCRSAELAADYNIITRANIYFRPKDTLTLGEAMGITMNALKISLSNSSTLSISGRLPAWQKRLILTIKEQQIKLDIRDTNRRGIALYNPEIGIRVSDFDMSHKMTRGEFFQLVIALRNPNQSFSCSDYRYSSCPSTCEKRCISSSCTGSICTDDCDGIGSCIPRQNTSSTCYDSDGDNPNTAGYVQLSDTSFGVNGKKYDVCDGNSVREYTCLNSTTYSGDKSYSCQYGCANGACKSSSSGDIYDNCLTYTDGCNECSITSGSPVCTERYCIWQGIPKCYTCKSGSHLENGRCVVDSVSCKKEGEAVSNYSLPPAYQFQYTCCSGLTEVGPISGGVGGNNICAKIGDGYCDSRYESELNSSDCISICKKEGELANPPPPPNNLYSNYRECCSGLSSVSPKGGGDGPNICAKIGDEYCDTRYESTFNSSDCQIIPLLDTSICQSYYDGCNTCSRGSSGQTVCTLMYCVAIVKPAYCTSYISYIPYSQSQDSAFLAKVSTEIKNYVSDLSCTDSSQCRDSYFGDGQCYGDMFIMYSTKNIDQTLLTEKTTYYTNAKKRFNETYTPGYKLPSIQCPLLSPPPPLICHDNICQRDDIMAYKPVIYLYPKQTTTVSVKLDFQGKLVVTYPAYDEQNGWFVIAQPNGTLTDKKDGREYSYLFWEGAYDDIRWDLSQGFVVKGEDTVKFLQEKLAYLGLTPKEYNEFIVFWYPRMKDNAYNFITFAGKEYTDSARLTITPTPDSMLRVFMVYKPLTGPISIPEQSLTPFIRTGFSVIEWGGTEVR